MRLSKRFDEEDEYGVQGAGTATVVAAPPATPPPGRFKLSSRFDEPMRSSPVGDELTDLSQPQQDFGPFFSPQDPEAPMPPRQEQGAMSRGINRVLDIGEDVSKSIRGIPIRAAKQFRNIGSRMAHGLGESDPVLYAAYEAQAARVAARKKAGQYHLTDALFEDEKQDIIRQLRMPAAARDDEDLQKISAVHPLKVNPFFEHKIPPRENPGNYIADTLAGIGSFVAQIAFLKKVLPTAPSQLIWELQNIAAGNKPGKGAAINTALKGIEQIPTVSKLGKATKVGAGGGLFGGLTYAEGGDFVDTAVSTAIGAGFQAWGIKKQNQFLKNFKSHLRKAEYAKYQKAVDTGNRQAKQAYRESLAGGTKPAKAKAEYQRALKGATKQGESNLRRMETRIDQAVDIVARKLHHGKMKGREAELAQEIIDKGLTRKTARKVKKVGEKPARDELARKGYPKEVKPGEEAKIVKTSRKVRKAGEAAKQPDYYIEATNPETGQKTVVPANQGFTIPENWKAKRVPFTAPAVPEAPISPPPSPGLDKAARIAPAGQTQEVPTQTTLEAEQPAVEARPEAITPVKAEATYRESLKFADDAEIINAMVEDGLRPTEATLVKNEELPAVIEIRAQDRTEEAAARAAKEAKITPTEAAQAPAEAEKVEEFEKGAKVRAKLLKKAEKIDKERGYTITDVTPEGFGPSEATEPAPSLHLTTEQQRLLSTINEAKTILKGDVSGEKRAAIERSLKKAEDKYSSLTKKVAEAVTEKPEGKEIFTSAASGRASIGMEDSSRRIVSKEVYEKETPPDVQDVLRKKYNLAPLTVTKDTKDAENLLDGYFAERDEKEMEAHIDTNKFQQQIKVAVGSKKHGHYKTKHIEADKAIQVYVDLKNNPDQIKYYDKLTDKQKKIVDLAQNLPPELEAVAKSIIAANKEIGLEALDVGVISNVMDNYSMRLWANEKQRSWLFRKFGTKTARAKHRTLEGILHGWSLGKELQVKGATNAHEVMRRQVADTIVDRQLLKTAKQWGLISDQRLEKWVQIEHPNFTDWRWAGKAEDAKAYGKNFFVTKDGNLMERVQMYAAPDLGKHLNNALGTSALYKIPGVRWLTQWNAMLKRWILFTSFFHHQAYVRSYNLGGRTGFKDISPKKAYAAGRRAIENFTPELRRGVRNGLTLGKIQDYDESVLRGKQTVWGRMARKVKPVGATVDQINKLRDWNEHVLFHKLGPFLKAQAYLLEYKSLVKRHVKQLKSGTMDMDDLAKIAANLANDDFGGLHLQRKGRNPTLQHFFRLLALAPDWTESNVASAIKAFKGGASGKVYRAFWARIAVKGLLAVALFNYLMALFDDDDEETKGANERFIRNYKEAWKNGKMRWMDVDVTPIYKALGGKADKRKYFSLIGHFKDPIKFVARDKIKEGPLKGFPDPVRSLIKSAKYKGSVLTRIVADGISGKNWAGREFTTFSELMGIDDKGVYVTTSKAGGYEKGDPKGGKLKGKLTKWSMGGVKPLGLEQVPSFLIYETRQNMPIQVQNGISYLLGQMDGFDASLKSAGVYISSTWDPAEKLVKGKSLKELKKLRRKYVYAKTSRKQGRIKGKPHKGKERIVEGIDKAIKELTK